MSRLNRSVKIYRVAFSAAKFFPRDSGSIFQLSRQRNDFSHIHLTFPALSTTNFLTRNVEFAESESSFASSKEKKEFGYARFHHIISKESKNDQTSISCCSINASAFQGSTIVGSNLSDGICLKWPDHTTIVIRTESSHFDRRCRVRRTSIGAIKHRASAKPNIVRITVDEFLLSNVEYVRPPLLLITGRLPESRRDGCGQR
jgi:hypothetical protein